MKRWSLVLLMSLLVLCLAVPAFAGPKSKELTHGLYIKALDPQGDETREEYRYRKWRELWASPQHKMWKSYWPYSFAPYREHIRRIQDIQL